MILICICHCTYIYVFLFAHKIWYFANYFGCCWPCAVLEIWILDSALLWQFCILLSLVYMPSRERNTKYTEYQHQAHKTNPLNNKLNCFFFIIISLSEKKIFKFCYDGQFGWLKINTNMSAHNHQTQTTATRDIFR